jgi:hypothetical protein
MRAGVRRKRMISRFQTMPIVRRFRTSEPSGVGGATGPASVTPAPGSGRAVVAISRAGSPGPSGSP